MLSASVLLLFYMKGNIKILWVEDEDSLREVMCELLRQEGFQCTPANDGVEAQKLLQKENFDLLISDFNMPNMDGAHLLFWCRQSDLHMPVIFVTATVERLPIEDLALQDCCCSMMNKPFSIEVLMKEIENALGRNHEFDCKGEAVPLNRGDYRTDFPGKHYLK